MTDKLKGLTDLESDDSVSRSDDMVDKPYAALTHMDECWVVFGRGGLAFRFGPFSPEEAGSVMIEACERGYAGTLIGVCGREVDWELVKDLGVRIKQPIDESVVAALDEVTKKEP